MLKRKPQQQRSKAASIAAPVGGWNARDSLADMAIHDAVSMENWKPLTTTAEVREGYSEFADGDVGAQVETLMAYNGSTTEQLFAATNGGIIHNVTNGGEMINTAAEFSADPGVITTPYSAALNITGDIDITAYVMPDLWINGAQHIVNRANAGDVSFRFFITTSGALVFNWSDDGVNYTHTATSIDNLSAPALPPFSDGEAGWVRVTLDVNNGAGGYTVTFYTSTDGDLWSQLGIKISSTPTTSIFNSAAGLRMGINTFAANSFVGLMFNVDIYNGINGTLATSFASHDGVVGAATVTSSQTGEVYTVTAPAAIIGDGDPNLVLSGLANGRFQHVNFTTSGGSFLVMCNGADDVYNYDGTTWTNPSITGVTSSTLNTVNIHKSRLWFTQVGTLKAWYLPTQSIAGAANALDLSAYCPHGGYLMAMGTWTMDAGYGVDDMAVFVTNQGDCLVYRGTDPSSATTWALVGVWWIGQPIGRRCFVKYKGDMLIICEDGLFSLANALQSSRVDPKLALTDKIEQTMQESVALYRNNFGWQVIPFDGESLLIMNVPTQEGQYQEQYVMNTITGAWCKFTGWDANCWELFNDSIYFGGNGFVGRAFHTNADNGTAIAATCQQAFNYFKTPGQSKRFAMMRPTLMTNGSPDIQGAINVDFDLSPPSSNLSTLTITGATWDSAVWDTGLWQNTLITSRNWQGATGIGYAGGVRLDSSTNGIQLQWVATDVVMESGGII